MREGNKGAKQIAVDTTRIAETLGALLFTIVTVRTGTKRATVNLYTKQTNDCTLPVALS